MTQLTRAISSPSRMRKIQSSPTREIRNFWQRDAHTEENRERRSKSKISEINPQGVKRDWRKRPVGVRLKRTSCGRREERKERSENVVTGWWEVNEWKDLKSMSHTQRQVFIYYALQHILQCTQYGKNIYNTERNQNDTDQLIRNAKYKI